MPKPRNVAILTFDRGQLLDVAGPLQVFATANERHIAAGGETAYAPVVIAREASVRSIVGALHIPGA